MKQVLLYAAVIGLALCLTACAGGSKKTSSPAPAPLVQRPVFEADSALHYVSAQCAFGPRVPGSAAHCACGDYLVAQLRRHGALVVEQSATAMAFNGQRLPLRNIIASYKPELSTRVLLMAHWDSRPWCDAETETRLRNQPVLGANDGASGVGVLLEIARCLNACPDYPFGIDIVLFDGEDYGPRDEDPEVSDAWCLGSQYWARHPHTEAYRARYGILLDMVGGRQPVFLWDYASLHYAPDILHKVWNTAEALGYGDCFVKARGGVLTDDHLYVNRIRGIPSIDIVDFDEDRGGFPEYWHTAHDDMDHVDPATLKAVGQTVMEVLYSY